MPLVQRIEVSYKSIASADLATRRVNIFIGEPNTGKSNLLEALALLSSGVSHHIGRVLRVQQPADLFFDHEIERDISLTINGAFGWHLQFEKQYGRFKAVVTLPGQQRHEKHFQPLLTAGQWPELTRSPFRYYAFERIPENVRSQQYGFLQPPFGENLPALLYSNKTFRESISSLFRSKDFRLEVRPQESQVLISKEVNDILYSYPFRAISETLQRIVFLKAVLETNSDAVLILDEPEANTFPFYTKYLAERIALDGSNQFFLTTHNPYVLTSLIEKTAASDLAVFITRMRNYRTEFHLASDAQLREMLNLTMDVFLDLDRFFPN